MAVLAVPPVDMVVFLIPAQAVLVGSVIGTTVIHQVQMVVLVGITAVAVAVVLV
jgi:hypothetical protein